MALYDLEYIKNISENILSNNNLDIDVQNYLDTILSDIKKPVYNIRPNFNNNYYNKNKSRIKNSKKFYKKSFQTNKNNSNNDNNDNNHNNNNNNDNDNTNNNDNDNDNNDKNEIESLHKLNINNNTYKINRLKDINNKSDYELITINIRKILNKITNHNYDKLKNEFLCYYKSISDDNNIYDFTKINLFIFESLIYNNSIFNKLYSDLLYCLININSVFLNLLNKNIDIFLNIHLNFLHLQPLDNLIIDNNKTIDKYKCFFKFYISCFKLELLQIDIFITTINNLQNELLTKIKIKDMKYYNEIITEFIFIIASNITLKYDDIIYNINYIANLKNNSYPSISNKIIFIHKDILEKYLK
mgnify:CR=1 FL=1|tara:strand:+ start:12741 stop:13814 length:1074 start_codon:yes stop_codon:yes gene_type:complete